MLKKEAIIGTIGLGALAAAAAKAHITKNVLVSGADAVDTKGTNTLRSDLNRKKTIAGKTVAKAKHIAGAAVHNYKTRAFQTGVLHGADPTREHPSNLWYAAEVPPLVGSEHGTFHYMLGYRLGRKVKHHNYDEKIARLSGIRKSIMQLPNYREYPHLGAVADGLHRVINNKRNDKIFSEGQAKTLKLKRKGFRANSFRFQPGGFTKTLKEQHEEQIRNIFKERSHIGDLAHKAGKLSTKAVYKTMKGVQTVSDADRALKFVADKTGVTKAIGRRIIRNSTRKLNPAYTENFKDNALQRTLAIVASPRVRDVDRAAAAFRTSMHVHPKATIHNLLNIGHEFYDPRKHPVFGKKPNAPKNND